MKKIIVLGAGLVGKAIAIDLCAEYQVTSVDINQENLANLRNNHIVYTEQADVQQSGVLEKLIQGYDLVIGAVPGFMGFETVKRVINTGKDIVDISFFPENALELDELAKCKNVTAIVDCGVAPGMSNLILGYHSSQMQIDSFECYVGGLPIERNLPFEYKAPFSPIDVIEEYTRPARLVENGQIVTKTALSEPELMDFPGIGTLEAFNTDGLRSLLYTMQIPNMKEKTLRYPRHIDKMKLLRDAGFFNSEPIEFKGKNINPLEFTSNILIKEWKLAPDEKEFTVMRIIVKGIRDGQRTTTTWDLYDEFDDKKKLSSMARTTGFTASAAARLFLDDSFRHIGICPPEFIGADEVNFDRMMKYLKQRNITHKRTDSSD